MALTLASVTITDAQMKALNTTPVTLISAPGAGKRIIVFGFSASSATTTNGGTSVTANIRYAGTTQNVIGNFTVISSGVNGARETQLPVLSINTVSNVLTNLAIEIAGSVNASGTYASSDGYHTALLYDLIDDPN